MKGCVRDCVSVLVSAKVHRKLLQGCTGRSVDRELLESYKPIVRECRGKGVLTESSWQDPAITSCVTTECVGEISENIFLTDGLLIEEEVLLLVEKGSGMPIEKGSGLLIDIGSDTCACVCVCGGTGR